MRRWITDTDPSARFALYTRANAGEVLPDPVSPLAWSLVWEPGVVMGWADTQVVTVDGSSGTITVIDLPES